MQKCIFMVPCLSSGWVVKVYVTSSYTVIAD